MFTFNHFWGTEVLGKPFIPFTQPHFFGLTVVFIGIALLMQYKPYLIEESRRRKVEILLASILITQQSLLYLWYITSGNFSLAESLPLYSCRLAILATIIMLLRRDEKIFDIIYYWGIAGGIIALITPDTSGFGPPHLMFIQYFVGHGTLIISIIYMMIIYGLRPSKVSLLKAYRVTSLYFVGIFFINKVVGGNYSYLNGKPDTPTLLDALPPYPFYIPVLLFAMFALFYLAYLPFAWSKDEQRDRSVVLKNS